MLESLIVETLNDGLMQVWLRNFLVIEDTEAQMREVYLNGPWRNVL
jgi:hypothetical protein